MKNKRVRKTHLQITVPLWVKAKAHHASIKQGVKLSQYIREILEQELTKDELIPDLCSACNGSGEGSYSESTCTQCKGSGHF